MSRILCSCHVMCLILVFNISAVTVHVPRYVFNSVPEPCHVSDFMLILVFEINAVTVHVPRHVSYSVPVPRHAPDFSFQNKCCDRARATSCLLFCARAAFGY